jgi:glycerophosphoryl diester phosphodiesterase
MRKSLMGLLLVVAAIYFWNASWLASAPAQPQLKLIAHRGVHQTFDKTGVDATTCTATRVHPPSHGFIENTIASMQAAFDAGADVVELDVHPTTDGQFAVFHDWALECRTDGTGVTRERDMAYLKTLDIGYGYTADGGVTYPLRGRGVGLMPTLEEVFRAFPGKKFLLNYKSRDAREADMLATLLAEHPEWREQVWAVYGGNEPTERAVALIKDLKGVSTRGARQCLLQYLGLGWTGYVPEACRSTYVMVPGNLAWLMWGWPNRLHARLWAAGSAIILLGPYAKGDPGTSGIDTPEQLSLVPGGFDGYVWTNKIETIGPALAKR